MPILSLLFINMVRSIVITSKYDVGGLHFLARMYERLGAGSQDLDPNLLRRVS